VSEPLFLGLDLGTTNAKAAAYDQHGNLVGASMAAYVTAYPRPGWAEQRPVDWVRALGKAIQGLMVTLGARKADLVAIGLSAHGPGVVLADVLARPMTYYAADSTLGAAIMAAVGSGCHGSLAETVAQIVHSAETALPDQVAAYDAAYEDYGYWREQLYPRQMIRMPK